jgi:hypothetical protein
MKVSSFLPIAALLAAVTSEPIPGMFFVPADLHELH